MTNSMEAAWAAVFDAAKALEGRRLGDLVDADPARADRLAIETAGLTVDLIKQPVDDAALDALLALARAADVEAKRAAMFSGAHVNPTEDRPALHAALASTQTVVDHFTIMAGVCRLVQCCSSAVTSALPRE